MDRLGGLNGRRIEHRVCVYVYAAFLWVGVPYLLVGHGDICIYGYIYIFVYIYVYMYVYVYISACVSVVLVTCWWDMGMLKSQKREMKPRVKPMMNCLVCMRMAVSVIDVCVYANGNASH